MERVRVKEEIVENLLSSASEKRRKLPLEASSSKAVSVIDLSSSSSSSGSDSDEDATSSGDVVAGNVNGKRSTCSGSGEGVVSKKRKRLDELGVVLPVGFLDPLPQKEAMRGALASPPLKAMVPLAQSTPNNGNAHGNNVAGVGNCKQFWKAGDYEGAQNGDWDATSDEPEAMNQCLCC